MGATGSQSHPPRPVPPTVQCPLARVHCVRCVCGCGCVCLGACTHCQVPGASAHLPPTRKEGRKRRPLRLAAHIRPSHPPALSPPSIHQHQHYSINHHHHHSPSHTTLQHTVTASTTRCQHPSNTLPTRASYRSHLPLDSASSAQSQHIPVLHAHRRLRVLPAAHRTLVALSQSHHQTAQPPNRPTTQIVNNSNRVSYSTPSLLLRYTNRNHAPPLSALLRLIAALSIPSPAISLLSSRQPPSPLVAKRSRQHHVHLPQPPVSSRLTRAHSP